MTASSRFAQSNSAGLPCYKCFAAGSSTYPCHMACISKSVTKDIISLSNYVPNSTEAPWMWCAIVGADRLASLSRDCQGQVRKVVLLWYCFYCVKLSFYGTAFAYGFLVEKGTQEPILQTRRVACETRYSWTKKRILGWGHVKSCSHFFVFLRWANHRKKLDGELC